MGVFMGEFNQVLFMAQPPSFLMLPVSTAPVAPAPLANALGDIPKDLAHRLQVACLAAYQAGHIQRERLHAPHQVRTKSSNIDLVTEVDQACDALISKTLVRFFPDDALLTEETFETGDTICMDRCWVVDPLDGTTNYTHAFPFFCVSIAYVVQGQPLVGVVYAPLQDECFTAVKGYGAWLNGRPLRVTGQTQLHHALLATGFPYDAQQGTVANLPHFGAFLCQAQAVRRPGAAALDLACVACGRLDGFWELKLSPWDVAAGMLLVTEAGGQVSDLTGQPMNLAQRPLNILASNGPLHGPMQQVLALSGHA
jgi:myo-inositol-1(or 4)-monophosphatase